jgi:hypothetical protein
MRVASQETASLRQALFDAYARPKPKHLSLDVGHFIVDDRGPKDLNARKKLFSWFCTMVVEVIDAHTIKLRLIGNIPSARSVDDWRRRYALGEIDRELKITVTKERTQMLSELASARESPMRRAQRASRLPSRAVDRPQQFRPGCR